MCLGNTGVQIAVQFRQIIAEKIVRRGGTKLVEENSKIGVFLNRVLHSKCLLLSIARTVISTERLSERIDRGLIRECKIVLDEFHASTTIFAADASESTSKLVYNDCADVSYMLGSSRRISCPYQKLRSR